MYSLRSCLPLAILSSSDLIAWVKQCLVNLTGVHQVAGVPCANIDLKEWVKRNVWDMKIPMRWNRDRMQRTLLEDECVWYVSFVFLALKVTCIQDFCLASDFHNEGDGSCFKVFQHRFEVFTWTCYRVQLTLPSRAVPRVPCRAFWRTGLLLSRKARVWNFRGLITVTMKLWLVLA